MNNNLTGAKKKKVIKYDLNGKYIDEYVSISEAARSVGANNPGPISLVCKGVRKRSSGHLWKFKEDVLNPGKDLFKKELSKIEQTIEDAKLK